MKVLNFYIVKLVSIYCSYINLLSCFSLSSLIGFAPQFESQGSRLCWENLCLSVRAGISSLGCGTGLKVPPTVGALPRIPRGQNKKKFMNLELFHFNLWILSCFILICELNHEYLYLNLLNREHLYVNYCILFVSVCWAVITN